VTPYPPDFVLQAEALTKSFGVVKALQQVDLDVRPGSLHAVVGHNGAGKSTLMNLLSGVYPPDSGQIRVSGKPVRFTSPRDAMNQGVSMVHQELSIIPDLDVAENMFLGREPLSSLGIIRRQKLYDSTEKLLAELNLDASAHTRCSTLSVGARQMIEIAQAISRDAKLLILDEPTSALSEAEQERLFSFIAQLKARSIGILYISHKLDEIQTLSDTVTVLRDGKRVTTSSIKELDHARMVELMVGHSIAKGAAPAPPQAEVTFEVSKLTSKAAHIDDVSFAARRGEIIGLAGMLGSGRTELCELLFGIRHFDHGEIRLMNKPIRLRTPRDAMGFGIALVPEDRRNQGIFAGLPIWKNMSLASFHDAFRAALGFVRQKRAKLAAREEVGRFKIRTPSINQEIQLLSGGNQQKVILARWLLRRPQILLLDDPTAGVDVGAKDEIHAFVRQLAAAGLTVIMISSEFAELLDTCHRILVIRNGKIVGEMDPHTSTEAHLVRVASASVAA
jgi:inositol transport system ATP-binding protein